MSECKHGVSVFSSRGCYNCLADENESLRTRLAKSESRYKCHGCEDEHSTDNMVAYCASCFSSLRTRLADSQKDAKHWKDRSNEDYAARLQAEQFRDEQVASWKQQSADWELRCKEDYKKVAAEHELYLSAHRDNMKGATMLMEMKEKLAASVEQEQRMREALEKPEAGALFVLSFCKGAINDAIYSEDGLDGATGEAVLKMIATSEATIRAALSPAPAAPKKCEECGGEEGRFVMKHLGGHPDWIPCPKCAKRDRP